MVVTRSRDLSLGHVLSDCIGLVGVSLFTNPVILFFEIKYRIPNNLDAIGAKLIAIDTFLL